MNAPEQKERKDRGSAEDAQAAQRVAARAIRRLNVLEWLILAGAMLIALAGGALVAALVVDLVPIGFRPLWAMISLLLFLVPGVIALTRLEK